ncbi:MAG: hypothetical protein FWF41_09460, partial [Betaproteobacteria bacterium]|nr:hypothetical protein [Betaproteobacteria bacterium]
IVAAEILRLSQTYDGVAVDRHVVMPNHVHLLITIFDSNGRQDAAPTVARFNNNGRQNAAPAVSRMIGQWKRAVSMKAGFSPWQKSFHDHVIRNEQDYLHIVEYIENNPLNWSKDCFFVGEGS